MKPPIYVVDTHTVVWFVKGHYHRLGINPFIVLIHPRARLVVSAYSLEEVQRKFEPRTNSANHIRIPPTALLRLLHQCTNIRILPRGSACLAKEFQLHSKVRNHLEDIPFQDIPIAATVLVVRDYYHGPVVLITSDRKLKAWASRMSLTVIMSQVPLRDLPPGR
jgi:PIN domain nuclease of toxin-antitoxin system